MSGIIVDATIKGCSRVIDGLRGGSILCGNLRGVDIVFGGLGDNGAALCYLDGLNAVSGTFVSCSAICSGPIKGCSRVINGLRGGSILCGNLRGIDIFFGGLGDIDAALRYLDGLNAVSGTFVGCGAICSGPKGDGKVVYNRDDACCRYSGVLDGGGDFVGGRCGGSSKVDN